MGQRSDLRKLKKILRKVDDYREWAASLSDAKLKGMTRTFRKRLRDGETTDDILPEAFAVMAEADYRVLGLYPFDVQILGGIALAGGYLAEMNTGEGKTLTATLPLYLYALTGESTILVTSNDYLVRRDAEEMGQVYRFMGLSIAMAVQPESGDQLSNEEKREIYNADIVYTTHGTLGFDYLFNNMVKSAEDRFMRPFSFIIIDEADSVLLDAAQTPLVISGSPRVQSNLYEMADFFITTLKKEEDYTVEDRKVWLTEEGIHKAEVFFRIENFYAARYFEINRHVTLALRAHTLFQKDKDYVITDKDELLLLDGGTGRVMPGVKLRGGIHQAIEVKEKLELSQENRSMASVTYQNLFLMFPNMSGMSGTLADASEELLEVYDKKVIVIPPNKPLIREDRADRYFANSQERIDAVIERVCEIHGTGQPVLIVASTMGETERLSTLLVEQGIAHSVLNANNAYWEAQMIAEAGQPGAVTVATSMAGRGTDIKLGHQVRKLGGLAVIGVGRMKNVRLERQARGRAGRQGDPGFSEFYVSLEDDTVTDNTAKNLERYIEGSRHMGCRRMKRIINRARNMAEEAAEASRKQSVEYDRVMKRQREVMYDTRNNLLDGRSLSDEQLAEIVTSNVKSFLKKTKKPDAHDVSRYILDNISYQLDDDIDDDLLLKKAAIREYLEEKAHQRLREQRRILGEDMDDFIRIATLEAIDEAWVEQVDYLQQMQNAVTGRSSAQRNPLYEYHREGLDSFMDMEENIRRCTMRNILLSDMYMDDEGHLMITFP